ncbi:MAG: alanine--tRNA ligase [Gammaproteobacteria bacterium]
MKSNELRQTFLDYFGQQQHTIVPSSSLVPAEDPTLLFTNAGMVQFKKAFLGEESRSYSRAASSQRCVRAGGKHNDLENVGYTARHHTFFEMLGNFSFGDYFKREAIQLAWRFLTEVLALPADKLWVTVFKEDDEAADIWLKELKVDPKRFSRCGEADNFWSMGDTGPCGPCTEIFYDHGPEIPGGPPGSAEQEGDRYIEIWNLVFMQYNRAADGTLTPLPKPSVDTGMGLERIAAVMQGVHSNYEIDIFRHLIQAIADLVGTTDLEQASLRVIADHIRAAAFLIADGVTPSNEGRGYVLRRIIRRAIRHGHKLGLREPFFYRLVAPLAAEMGEAYPELIKARPVIEKLLNVEEKQFAMTLDQGMKLLERSLSTVNSTVIPGELVFRLYDTYGFPPDLTADIARERNLTLDYPGFEAHMEKQRLQSQASEQFSLAPAEMVQLTGETEFLGYNQLSAEATVTALLYQNAPCQTLEAGQQGAVILDKTPFYAEAGGQVGDKGKLYFEGGVFLVADTQKQGLVYVHHGKMESGTLTLGRQVSAEVDAARHAIMANHSATHLLHAALRHILGEHVIQKGSLVEAERLRFDFSHFAPLTDSELQQVERLVNQQIRANLPCHIEFMSAETAKKTGAMALFNEKYGDQVRVLSMGNFSLELCGGTHVNRTGDIGVFKIIAETGIASGVRRIEAVTAEKTLDWLDTQVNQLQKLATILKAHPEEVPQKVQQLLDQMRQQDKRIEKMQMVLLRTQMEEWIQQAEVRQNIHILAISIPDAEAETLRQLVDQLKQKFTAAVILLASVKAEKIQIIAGVTKTESQTIKANELVSFVAQQLGGKGGGRADLAQGGGDKIDNLPTALSSVVTWVEGKL